MSKQYPGGIISKTPPTPSGSYETSTASGIWTLDQQAYWAKLGQWPTAGNPALDAQFNYVTMLLHGDGTNGAQNNTFLDSSTNNFTITRNGNTTQGSFSPYGSNWSNYLDGSSSFLSVPASSSFTFTGDYTIEAWLYITSLANNGNIFATWTGGGGSLTSSFQFNFESTGTVYCADQPTPAGVITVNNWIHVAASRSGTTQKIFINGVVQSTATVSGTVSQAATAYIGKRLDNTNYVQGYISNLRVVNGTAVYTSNFTPSTTPLTAITNTSLLTCQSNRFIDNSTNAFAITTGGTPSVQRFNPFGASTAYSTSVIGGSGYFDGSGDYLQVGPNTALGFGTGDFTFEAWVYPNVSGGTHVIADITLNIFTMYVQNNELKFYFGATQINSGLTVTPFAWNHVAWVRSSGSLKMYVNGVGNSPTSVTNDFGSSEQMRIGVENSSYWNGYISNFRAVKGTAVYTANFTPPTAPVTAISGTSLLTNMTNGAIYDNAMINDLETVGDAQISTSVVKYGTGSMYFDGTGDWLSTPNTVINSLGSGAFTMEMWVYRLGNGTGGTSAYDALLGSYINATTALYGIYITRSSGVINFYNSAGLVSSTNSLSNSSWTHIAICRTSANNLQIFINGTSGYSATNTGTGTLTNPFYIGHDGTGSAGNNPFYGYIDDLRITKGYARYTANFTPPTAAFPNIGP